MRKNLVGPGGRLFGELQPGPDETAFQIDNTSEQYFQSPYYLMHQRQVQPVPAPRVTPPRLNLADVVGTAPVAAIQKAGRIVFHSVGDTGAAKKTGPETEESVADLMVKDLTGDPAQGPAFFFHLGDVVYYFGEAQYYYDQFYEPYRAYDRPIFAIPGNHDGVVFGPGTQVPQAPTLAAFLQNFCAPQPGPSPSAGGLVRSVMTQPGVYFTLDAPFVSIIGLYSNVLEGPGVISSQGGKFPAVGDAQLAFLKAELARLKPARDRGELAIVIAVHHPALSVDAKHGGSTGMLQDLDAASTASGVWPDVVLSGHAHLYQRFTRTVAGRQIPFVVAGSGGFSVTPPANAKAVRAAQMPLKRGPLTLETAPIFEFGYLTVTTDAKTLSIAFRTPSQPGGPRDIVTVDLASHQLVASAKAPGRKGTRQGQGPWRQGVAASRPAARAGEPAAGASCDYRRRCFTVRLFTRS